MNEQTNLRVMHLRVKNVMRLRTADVTLDGSAGIVPVVGANGAGKTTLLQSIQMAVAGKDSIPDEPIRAGAEDGEIVLDIGEYRVKRTFTGKDSYIHLEDGDGNKVAAPQRVLDGLFNSLTVDPLAFMRQTPKEQAATLMKLAGLDFTKADQLRKETFEERTGVNRDLERAKARRGPTKTFPPNLPAEEQDASMLADELANLVRAQESAQQAADRIVKIDERLGQITKEIERLHSEQLRLSNERREMDAEVRGGHTEDAEIEAKRKELADIGNTNQLIRDRLAFKRADEEVRALEEQSEALTDKLERIDAKKKGMLAAAALPVEGLAFDPDGVRFNGVPITQASRAEQIRVAVAVALAMNPRLRVVLVRDASLLDEDSRAAMRAAAEEFDAQLWLEFVEYDGTDGVHVIDGAVEYDAGNLSRADGCARSRTRGPHSLTDNQAAATRLRSSTDTSGQTTGAPSTTEKTPGTRTNRAKS